MVTAGYVPLDHSLSNSFRNMFLLCQRRGRMGDHLRSCGLCGTSSEFQPVLMACTHVFCSPCLSKQSADGSLSCPLCGCAASGEKGGTLSDHDLVRETIQLALGDSARCEECSSADATVDCSTCDSALCAPCYQKTHSSRIFRAHPVSTIAKGRRPRPDPVCSAHPGERIKYIQMGGGGGLLCRDCVLLGGLKNGDYISVAEAARDARALVDATLLAAEARVAELREGQRRVANVIPATHEEFARVIDTVEARAERMGGSVKERRDTWARKASAEREASVTALVDRCSALSQLRDGVANAAHVADVVAKRCDDLDALEVMGDISRALAAVVLSNDASSSHEGTQQMTNVGGGAANGRAGGKGRGPGGGAVYVFGGSDGESDLGCGEAVGEDVMSVGATGRDKGGGWAGVECSMGSKRRSAGCAVVGGRLFVIGGWGGSGALASCEMYDGVEGTWRGVASMHTKRQAMGVAALHGKIYAAGGYDGSQNLSSVERFDPSTGEWTILQNMSVGRRGCAAAAAHGKVFVLGGHDGARQHSSVEVYNTYTNSWSMAAAMGTPRRLLCAAAVNGTLVVFGGNDGARALSSCEKYDNDRGVWEEIKPMGSRRQGAAAEPVGGRILVVGGWDGLSNTRHASAELYEPSLNEWQAGPSMARARFGLVAAVL